MLSELQVKVYPYNRYSITAARSNDKIKLVIYMMCNTIGNNIKKLRREKEIKQEVLANSLHLRRQTVSSYERGVTLPNIFVLIQIADYFDVTLDELAGRKELTVSKKKEQ